MLTGAVGAVGAVVGAEDGGAAAGRPAVGHVASRGQSKSCNKQPSCSQFIVAASSDACNTVAMTLSPRPVLNGRSGLELTRPSREGRCWGWSLPEDSRWRCLKLGKSFPFSSSRPVKYQERSNWLLLTK